MTEWIGTANHGFASLAMEELRRMIQGLKFTQLIAGETFRMEVPLSREAMVDLLRTNEPIFLRHIQAIDRILPIQGNADDLQALSELVRHARARCASGSTAIHLRKVDGSRYRYSAADTKTVLEAVIMELGGETTMQAPEQILSVFAGTDELYVGWGTPAEQLSDWPGGAVRFQREEGQISRAKFKLLEAERAFDLHFETFRDALDIGAAPGGWTQLLLERGLRVTAIDPAELHPKLDGYPRLTALKKNASDVTFAQGSFDLLVCDMSWSPMQMAKLVLEKTDALREGAVAVITIKLMHKKPLQTIRDVIAKLETAFELRKAKQLFHNRDEMTIYMAKR
ncbi:23S rRNA (cytidine2498-2'-O)-methyltransferase [Paenibacillus sp. UNC496MF]|uniref:SAM-dependent methyltransferase n=1 Tax=Paenibacillus sp. UNC496MF TaxID=1502753 RepID=UPI0008E08B13|nr:SAM-dependent methyltransferase [Paenibacillus sp. UNC496MF]SFI32424.1 23S rRNA (cytidine2498-2'-O)-methyltransferase [Paenibacillus sp. UNC496MF]